MSDNPLEASTVAAVPRKTLHLRGYTIDQQDIQKILQRLQKTVTNQGWSNVNVLQKPDEVSQEDWGRDKELHVKRAFQVTTTVVGVDHSSIFAPTVENVFTEQTPGKIASIFATNRTAFEEVCHRPPPQVFELNLDFTGPQFWMG